MTPDSQPQSQQTQDSQSETKKTEGLLSRLGWIIMRPLIKRQTKEEIKQQIETIINPEKIKEDATELMNSEISEKVKEVRENLEKTIAPELRKNYEKLKNDTQRLGMILTFIGLLFAALAFVGNPILNDILSIDVLKSNIETLKEDIDNIEDQR